MSPSDSWHIRISGEEVLAGFDRVSVLYPAIPPLSIWRAWEYAAYQHIRLEEPVLDIGCGDGRFFRLLWPEITDVTGVDSDPQVVELARDSGIYRDVVQCDAQSLRFMDRTFATVFANCSIEHMDRPELVLSSIREALRPSGLLVLSVVTEKFLAWDPIPGLGALIGDGGTKELLLDGYRVYHHLVSALPEARWEALLREAGFQVLTSLPILPERCSRLFLFLDHLWHLPQGDSEFGATLYGYLRGIPGVDDSLRQVLKAFLLAETNWTTTSGLVMVARAKA